LIWEHDVRAIIRTFPKWLRYALCPCLSSCISKIIWQSIVFDMISKISKESAEIKVLKMSLMLKWWQITSAYLLSIANKRFANVNTHYLYWCMFLYDILSWRYICIYIYRIIIRVEIYYIFDIYTVNMNIAAHDSHQLIEEYAERGCMCVCTCVSVHALKIKRSKDIFFCSITNS